MRRRLLFAIAMLAVCLAAGPAFAAKSKLLPNATVKSVSGTSLTVTADGKDTTFSVDAKTHVTGKGIGTKTAAKGGKATIADLLKEGDRVSVTYEEKGAVNYASRIQVADKPK